MKWSVKKIRKMSLVSAFGTANAVSFAKEATDKIFDWNDIAADEFGAVGTTVAIALIDKDNILNMSAEVIYPVIGGLLIFMFVADSITTPNYYGGVSAPVQTISAFWTFDGDGNNWKFMEGQ